MDDTTLVDLVAFLAKSIERSAAMEAMARRSIGLYSNMPWNWIGLAGASTPHGQAALRSRPPRLARNLQVDNWPELRPNTLDALQQFVERGVDLLHEPIKAFAANEFDLTWLMR